MELQRARTIILIGLAIWAAGAVVVELAFGDIATVVLVGWLGSGVLCFAFTVWPLGLAQRRAFAVEILHDDEDEVSPPEPARPPHHAVEPTTDVVDLRDTELDPRLAEEIARALDPSTSQ